MQKKTEIICTGPSMLKSIMPGDKVEITKVAFDKLRPGDVIVYNNPEKMHLNVIHRIIGRDVKGLITRGDNNSDVDPYRVRPEHRPQKVTVVYRGSQQFRLKHRMSLHRLRLTQMYLRKIKSKIFFPIYIFIAKFGLFYIFGRFLKTEIRKFKRPGRIELQLFYGKRRIGVFKSENETWLIRFPWRLIYKAPIYSLKNRIICLHRSYKKQR